MSEEVFLNKSCFTNYKEDFTYEPGSTPFIVRISNDNYIPLNCIVFADNKDRAKEIVMMALEWQKEKDYTDSRRFNVGVAKGILKDISIGKKDILVTPINKTVISKIQWADNDTI